MKEILQSVDSISEIISLGVVITIEGILVVFAILILIMLTIYAMGMFSGAKPKKAKKSEQQKQNSLSQPVEEIAPKEVEAAVDENEIIAVLTAAVAACMGQSAASVNIRSYKKVSSAWNNAAKREVLDNRF